MADSRILALMNKTLSTGLILERQRGEWSEGKRPPPSHTHCIPVYLSLTFLKFVSSPDVEKPNCGDSSLSGSCPGPGTWPSCVQTAQSGILTSAWVSSAASGHVLVLRAVKLHMYYLETFNSQVCSAKTSHHCLILGFFPMETAATSVAISTGLVPQRLPTSLHPKKPRPRRSEFHLSSKEKCLFSCHSSGISE